MEVMDRKFTPPTGSEDVPENAPRESEGRFGSDEGEKEYLQFKCQGECGRIVSDRWKHEESEIKTVGRERTAICKTCWNKITREAAG